MNTDLQWLALGLTVGLLVIYESATAWRLRRGTPRLARSAHASLREAWFAAVSQQKGSEILAVQTLRNSLMSATMTASTAALGLMGTLTLAAPSLHDSVDAAAVVVPHLPARLALELVLIGLLFSSLVASAMAVRYYNHAGFICGMPTESAERQRWAAQGAAYVRRAGLLYGWGLRQLVLVAPILAALLHPFAGPVAALAVIAVMAGFDRAAQP
jgi:hypothetical protein